LTRALVNRAYLPQSKPKINALALRHKHGAKKVGVFGSYSRGEAGADGDLDLLVEFTEKKEFI